MMGYGFDPLLPYSVIAVLVGLGLITAFLRVRMAPLGAFVRVLATLVAGLFLLGPESIQQTYNSLRDQALILLDDSGSMKLAGRDTLRDEAAERLKAQLEEQGTEVVTARFGDEVTSDLAQGLAEGLAGTERSQLSGVFVLTDGRISSVEEAASTPLPAPLHAMIVGDPSREKDRHLSWVSAPRFGLVGEPMRLQLRIDDTENTALLPLTLRIDGEILLTQNVPTGEVVTIDVPIDRPGERVVDVSIPAAPDELSTRNNGVTAEVNIIRDRLRVLLISGEPHAGERVWRNVLKSDPAVDLVHFTILKPADKYAAASDDELNLIPFPSRELFLEKLKHFNVVIFDRYTYRGVITSFELAEVARYVEQGGAVLIAAGPELAMEGSLAAQPNLSYILPATPTGAAVETPYVPTLTDVGLRHPITAPLEGRDEWGRWLRRIPAEARRGQVLMEAGEDAPLLVTQRLGDGRIAMMLSDHLWLWARGFDGGGPHREFLRRLVHWLMAEPELEEESLSAALAEDGTLTITRRSLSEDVGPVTIRREGAPTEQIALEEQGSGSYSASMPEVDADLVRLETTLADGRVLNAAAVRARGQSPEFAAVTSSSEAAAQVVATSGGGIFAITRPGDANIGLRTVRADRGTKAGRGWAGLTPRRARAVLSEARDAALPRWVFALAAGGFTFFAWLLESGRLTLRIGSSQGREDGYRASGVTNPAS
ncbi:MAG: hypothetical protein AAF830_04300 [Pseudomonadota bacterium]